TFFIKEASSPTFAAWHQDSTYFGLDPYEQVSAWVALTDASQDAGCIEVLSAHGRPRQMRHVPKKLANSINRTGQTITEPLDESDVHAMPLEAGQFSLHHTLCVHRSAPNNTPHRRIGLGINYLPGHGPPTIPRARSVWSCPMRRAAAPTPWRASSPSWRAKAWASRS